MTKLFQTVCLALPEKWRTWSNSAGFFLLVHVRTMFLLGWAIPLAVGGYIIHERVPVKPAPGHAGAAAATGTPPAHWTAAHDLPLNWRIEEPDIVSAGALDLKPLSGKYLHRPIAKGQPIVPSDLEAEPSVPDSGATLLYLLPLAAGDERALNAGSHIDLFDGAIVVVGRAGVAAVRCKTTCEAIVQVSPLDQERLRNSDPKKLEWVLRK